VHAQNFLNRFDLFCGYRNGGNFVLITGRSFSGEMGLT